MPPRAINKPILNLLKNTVGCLRRAVNHPISSRLFGFVECLIGAFKQAVAIVLAVVIQLGQANTHCHRDIPLTVNVCRVILQ